MRLTCPNCKAQYEVEESVIPEGGRDVQCSACGHTWYQYPLSVALQMRADEIDDAASEGPGPQAATTGQGEAQRRLDRSVMDLLREEAERELRERRGDGGVSGAGSRNENGRSVRPARPHRPAREAEDNTAPAETVPAEGADDASADRPSRRNLLPDIEELSSTLEPRRDKGRSAGTTESAGGDDPSDERRGLLRGLSLVVIIVGVLLALYLLAPVLAAQVPALEDSMAGYVALVDSLRARVTQWMAQLIATMSGDG